MYVKRNMYTTSFFQVRCLKKVVNKEKKERKGKKKKKSRELLYK